MSSTGPAGGPGPAEAAPRSIGRAAGQVRPGGYGAWLSRWRWKFMRDSGLGVRSLRGARLRRGPSAVTHSPAARTPHGPRVQRAALTARTYEAHVISQPTNDN